MDPTKAEFLVIFSEFASVDSALLDFYYDQAVEAVPKNCFGNKYSLALYLFLANLLSQTSSFRQSSIGQSSRVITKKKVGDVEVSYQVSGGSSSSSNVSTYSIQYEKLLKEHKSPFAGFVAGRGSHGCRR